MSAIASFALLPKDDFEAFCKLARLVPCNAESANGRVLSARMVTEAELKTPEYRKQQEHHRAVGDYLRNHGTEPFEYQWSGFVISELMGWLKEAKHINLMENKLEDADEASSSYIVFNQGTKEKYHAQLDPSNYREDDLAYSFLTFSEAQTNVAIKQASAKLNEEQLKQFAHMQKTFIQQNETQFPERGKAMMDGIKIIHQCLQLVDDNHVILLHIG